MPGKFLARAQSCAFAAIVASMVFVTTASADEISWGQPGPASTIVTIRDQSGDVPDELTVEVPDGYLAIPPAISVEEDSSGTIEIVEASEVPLG